MTKRIYLADQAFIEGRLEKEVFVYTEGPLIRQLGPQSDLENSKELAPLAALMEEGQVEIVRGGVLTPGLIDAHTHIGLLEEMDPSGDDVNELSGPVLTWLRARDGINPKDPLFNEALSAGITTVGVMAGSSNLIGGQAASLYTTGVTLADMLISDYAGLKAALGENPKRDYGKEGKAPFTRMGSMALIRQALYEGASYAAAKKKDASLFDFRLEPYRALFSGQVPLRLHAHRADDIEAALGLAREFNIRLVIEHASGAVHLLEALKEAKVKLAIGPFFMARAKREMVDLSDQLPARLAQAGLDFSIISDCPELPPQALRLMAMQAHKAGLSAHKALEAITEAPARILGLADRLGTIRPGLEANLCLFDRHPLDFYARLRQVLVLGGIVYADHGENPDILSDKKQ